MMKIQETDANFMGQCRTEPKQSGTFGNLFVKWHKNTALTEQWIKLLVFAGEHTWLLTESDSSLEIPVACSDS